MMKDISVLIVDDEPQARYLMLAILGDIPGLGKIREAQDAASAMREMEEEIPDVIFLDIEMPGQNGFDLVKKMRASGLSTPIIFTTAYHEYAIPAIRHSAFDYLLKPVSREEVTKCLNRLRCINKHSDAEKMDNLIRMIETHTRIKINIRSGFLLVGSQDICYAEAEGNYTAIYLNNGTKELASINLGKLQESLPERHFTRISRSTLINLDHLAQVNRKKRQCQLLCDGRSILLNVSTRHLQPLEQSCETLAGVKTVDNA